MQARRDSGLETALRIVNTDTGRNDMREAENVLAAMLGDEQRLLDVRLAQNDARARWVRWLVMAVRRSRVLTLLWAARLLNQAWSRSFRTEAEQRDLALRLRTTLDSLIARASPCSARTASSRAGTRASRCCSTCRRRCSAKHDLRRLRRAVG